MSAVKPKTFNITKDMLDLLSSMTALNLKGANNHAKRSIACLKIGGRKRKRQTIEREFELDTAFDIANAK